MLFVHIYSPKVFHIQKRLEHRPFFEERANIQKPLLFLCPFPIFRLTYFTLSSIIPIVNARKNASSSVFTVQRAFGWWKKVGKPDEYGSERQAEMRCRVGCDGCARYSVGLLRQSMRFSLRSENNSEVVPHNLPSVRLGQRVL